MRGDRIILGANAEWALGMPKAEGIVFWIVPEASTRIAALITGEADIVMAVPPLQAEQIESADNARLEVASGSIFPIWGGMVVDRPQFQDPKVRKAVNHAVNKQAIVDRLLRGYGRVMGQPCPANRSCWNADVEPYEYDPDKAQQLLKEAGATDLSITLNFPTGVVPQGNLVAQAVAADLERVGINVEIQQDEWSVFAGKLFDFENRQAGLGDLFLMYFGAGATLERIVGTILVSDRNWNWMHYDNPEVDNFFRTAETSLDDADRKQAMMKMAEVVHQDAPWLFMYEPFAIWGVNDRITWEPRIVDEFVIVEEMSLAE